MFSAPVVVGMGLPSENPVNAVKMRVDTSVFILPWPALQRIFVNIFSYVAHLISWADIVHFGHFLPSFIVKHAHNLQPLKGGCKFVFLFSSFSLFLPFSALLFLFYPASKNPKASKLPTNWGVRLFRMCLGILHWKRAGIFVNFFWSPFPGKRRTKIPWEIRGKFGAKFGRKFGTKTRKIQGTFVLPLFCPDSFFQEAFNRRVPPLGSRKGT